MNRHRYVAHSFLSRCAGSMSRRALALHVCILPCQSLLCPAAACCEHSPELVAAVFGFLWVRAVFWQYSVHHWRLLVCLAHVPQYSVHHCDLLVCLAYVAEHPTVVGRPECCDMTWYLFSSMSASSTVHSVGGREAFLIATVGMLMHSSCLLHYMVITHS